MECWRHLDSLERERERHAHTDSERESERGREGGRQQKC